MSMKRLQEAEELTLRVEKFADLASLLGSGSFNDSRIPDALEDFVYHAYRKAGDGEDDMSLLCRLFKAHSDEGSGDNGDDAEELSLHLARHRLNGVLLQVATPVKTFHKIDPAICSYSWGHYHTTWVYGTTFDKARAEAKKWANEEAASDKAASLKKKGGAAC